MTAVPITGPFPPAATREAPGQNDDRVRRAQTWARTRRSPRARRGALAGTIALAALLAACGGGSDADDVVEGVPLLVAPRITAATTTAPTTIPATTTTAAPTTTVAPTTSTLALPIPSPIPDPGSVEPEIPLGTLQVPKIGLSTTMYEGVTLSTLDRGPGHWPGSAMAGQMGNMVVAGHRMSHDRPFEDLDLLTPGDEMIVSDATGRHVYRVVGTDIVQPEALWILDQTPASTATLFACHPKGSTKQRIVVHLELVP